MKPVIRSLTLKGFRSFAMERVEFGNPTFLVGRNAAGKSNLVDALRFLQESMAHPLHQVIGNRGGIDAIAYQSEAQGKAHGFGLKVELGGSGILDGSYAFEVRPHDDHPFEIANEQCHVHSRNGEFWFRRDRKNFDSNVSGLQPLLDPQFLAFPLIGGAKQFSSAYRMLSWIAIYTMDVEQLKRHRRAEPQDRLVSNWSNGANVLQHLAEKSPQAVERISEILSAVTPARLHVKPRLQAGMVSIEFEQERSDGTSASFDSANMSDGTLRTLGLLLSVFQRSTRTLLVFEEPESTVHPGALSVVSDLLQEASRNSQVLVTTHSPELLDAKWITHEHIRVVYWEDDASRISSVGKAPREALQEHLMGAGELFRSNLLDAPPVHRGRSEYSLFGALR